MTSFHARLRTFGQELRRRRVLRVGIIYVAAEGRVRIANRGGAPL
jgi:hypothetical protein